MVETGTMSEQKRLGIAWGTTFAMIFSAVVAANIGGAPEPAEAEAVLAAHRDFGESVATPVVEGRTTSLKPPVEAAEEKPDLEQIPDALRQETTNDIPITTPDEEVKVKASAASTVAPVEPETPSESIAAAESFEERLDAGAVSSVTPDDTILQDVEVPETETETVSVEVDESDIAELEVSSDLEQSQTVEVIASEPDSPPVTEVVAIEVEENDDTVDLAVSTILTKEADQAAGLEARRPEPSSIKPVKPAAKPTSAKTPSVVVATKATAKQKPFFGVGIRNAADSVVTTIYAGSTAQSLGIKLGDRLVSVNDQPVANVDGLRSVLKSFEVDTPTSVEVERDGKKYQLGPEPLGAR